MAKSDQPIDPKHLEILNRIPLAPECGHWPHAEVDVTIATLTARAEAAERQAEALREREQRLTAQYSELLETVHDHGWECRDDLHRGQTCPIDKHIDRLAASPPAAPAGEQGDDICVCGCWQGTHVADKGSCLDRLACGHFCECNKYRPRNAPAADSQDAEASGQPAADGGGA
jgi:hypothetical protein